MRKLLSLSLITLAILTAGCTRIETGEVGLRVNASKELQGAELLPGSWNQTFIGDVLEFPVRDIAGTLENKQPPTADDVAMKDVDVFYTYSINPSCVSNLWVGQSRSLHYTDDKGNTYLMSWYMQTLVNNALYKTARKHTTKVIGDQREAMESDINTIVAAKLEQDKLAGCLTPQSIAIRNMQIPDSIRESAAKVVRSANELLVKENEVAIAAKEAARMQALSANSKSSIDYMDAQARLNFSEAAKDGKINTIVVPYDFKGIVNVPK